MTGGCTRPHSAQHAEVVFSGGINEDVAGGSPAAAMRRKRVPRRTAASSQSGSCDEPAADGTFVAGTAERIASAPGTPPGMFGVLGIPPLVGLRCDGASQLGLAWRSGLPINPRFSGCGTCLRCEGSRCCSATSDGCAGQYGPGQYSMPPGFGAVKVT